MYHFFWPGQKQNLHCRFQHGGVCWTMASVYWLMAVFRMFALFFFMNTDMNEHKCSILLFFFFLEGRQPAWSMSGSSKQMAKLIFNLVSCKLWNQAGSILNKPLSVTFPFLYYASLHTKPIKLLLTSAPRLSLVCFNFTFKYFTKASFPQLDHGLPIVA